MARKCFLRFACFMLFCVCSRELPVDSLEISNTTDQKNSSSDFATFENFDFSSPQNEASVPINDSIGRWNHARILKTTTEGYEEWWYITSGRRIINHKDYPGVTGAGTWEEINPVVVKQSSLSKKSPSSSGVASSSWKLDAFFHHLLLFIIPCAAMFFRNP